jgi:hypothetical protein
MNLRLLCCAYVAASSIALGACSDDDGGGDDANIGSGGGGGGGGIARAGNGASGSSGASGSGASGSGASGNGASGSSANGSGGANDTRDAGADDTGELPEVGGCAVFTADDAWNRDISDEPADATWTERIHALVGDIRLHPDYGNSGDEHYGLPINVVPASQPLVPVEFDDYPEESDPGPYPFPDPSSAKIEGGTPDDCDGDCHVLVVQREACALFEGYACSYAGGWHCANGARWSLSENSYGQRPKTWTSADAAGLPILPGLVRYDEVKRGAVEHAIRFTVDCTRANFVAPATHQAVPGGCDDPNAPPMGLRVRLRADYDLSSLSPPAQAVARAMQRYGMIVADNGSNFYFQGEDNPGWTEDDVEPLKTIPASAFEAIAPPALEP